jgi:hypothetical protein
MLIKLKIDRVAQYATQRAGSVVSVPEAEAARYVAEDWAEYVEEPEPSQSAEPSSSRKPKK